MYETLIRTLKATGIPFAEYAWDPCPSESYGTYQLDFDASALIADGERLEQAVEGSVDLFLRKQDRDKENKIRAVTSALRSVCGASCHINNRSYESSTKILHVEWVFQIEVE